MLARVPGRPTLYVLPASHPCYAVERGLQLKGLDYDRVDLVPVAHAFVLWPRFGRRTVPALRLPGGDRVSGSRAILRLAEGLQPDPPLLPADPELRARVDDAERWGEEELQPVGRRIAWAVFRRHPAAMASYAEQADLPLPDAVADRGAGLVAAFASRVNRADDATVRADLAALPGRLDRIDELIADGVLGGAAPNVADLQIASCLRLLLTFGDCEPLIAGRPGERLAREVFPDYPGRAPAGILPAELLAGAYAGDR